MALGRNLRQVGDAQDLGPLRQGAQQFAHHLRHGAADTHVHLVEYHAGHGTAAGRHHLDGETDARQLAAGGNPAQGLGGCAGVGADQEFDVLTAVGVGGLAVARGQGDLQLAVCHGQ